VAEPLPGVRHVVVLGFDGLSPEGIRRARTPTFDALRKQGAYTDRARAVMPTSSSSNWASMIMGAGPEQHGVTSNDWMPDKFQIAPVVKGSGGIFPTIFGALRSQRPSAKIAVFHDWKDFGRLVEPGVPDMIEHTDGPERTAERANAYLREHQPDLLFIHFDHIDHAGHESGWLSEPYIEAVELGDRLAGAVLQALDRQGMRGQSVVIVTSDHGGIERRHGGLSMEEIEIPWIIQGPNIAAGKRIEAPVNTFDTAATIAYILGLEPPEGWIARPVREVFQLLD
jgi:predicted AlkP superfamily pyrophosphatase or phosphodiesterase